MEAEYDFDEYRTWIVRDDVLSRFDDDDVAVAERVPHPTVDDLVNKGQDIVFLMF